MQGLKTAAPLLFTLQSGEGLVAAACVCSTQRQPGLLSDVWSLALRCLRLDPAVGRKCERSSCLGLCKWPLWLPRSMVAGHLQRVPQRSEAAVCKID